MMGRRILCILMFHILETAIISSVGANFETEKCSLENDMYHESFDYKRKVRLWIYLKDIDNVDYLSNVINLQFELMERWRNVDLPRLSEKEIGVSKKNLVSDSNISYIDALYPNLVIEERDYDGLDTQAGNPIYQSKLKWSKRNIFRQYFYLEKKRMLIKIFKFNLQTRCVISMQNYPFVESPCKISLRAGNPKSNFNYSICNLPEFINSKFSFRKFKAEATSLNKLCDDLNPIERTYLQSTSCFQLLITVESSKRFFYVHFLLTFLLLVISYLSLWVPIYNHTSRVAMLTLPIVGLYLFEQVQLKNDRILLQQSTSLHIWKLACLLYLGFMFFCYILAFYSLARVKMLVERADIGYLGYMLKCAKLVQDENDFTNQLTNFEERLRKFSIKKSEPPPDKVPSLPKIAESEPPLVDLNKIALDLKNNMTNNMSNNLNGPSNYQETEIKGTPPPPPPKMDATLAKTDSLTKMELLTDLELSTMKLKNLASKTSLPFKVGSASKTNLIFKSETISKTDILPKKPSILSKSKATKLTAKKTQKKFKRSNIKNFNFLPGSLKSLKIRKSSPTPLKLVKSMKSVKSEKSVKSVKLQNSEENRLKLGKVQKSENRLKLVKQKSEENRLKLIESPKPDENRLKLVEPQSEENKLKLVEPLEESAKTDEQTIRLRSMKSFYSIKPVEPVKERVGFDLQRELDKLKKELTLAKTLDKSGVDKQKRKTVQFLNQILGLKNQTKGYQRKKKIVSRFISSSKLKTIEFISLIPSDEYARIAVPISFFLFFYFYSLHFIF